MVCSQAAISIENAQLYAQQKQHALELEHKVAERTQELRSLNQELQRLATLDGLTKIANRRRFDEYLQQEHDRAQRENTPLSVLLCDVDHFKLFNDHYGHQAGDDCLIQVAEVLSQSVKRPVDLVARYGGEEFVLLLPNTSMEGAIAIANQVKANLAARQLRHEASLTHEYVSISVGISCTHNYLGITEPSVLVEVADKGLYLAKESGRNRYGIAPLQVEESVCEALAAVVN